LDAVEIRLRQSAGTEASGVKRRALARVPAAGSGSLLKCGEQIYADLSKTNPRFKKRYESLVPYRNDAYAWLQVVERGFDNFQICMRAHLIWRARVNGPEAISSGPFFAACIVCRD
jgi:hypothetical protein